MKQFFRIVGVILILSIVGLSVLSCDFFKEKDCSHCNGTGTACSWNSNVCSNCAYDYDGRCWVCSGTGKVPDWW